MRTIDWRSYTFQDYWHLLNRRKWYIILPLLVSITVATGMAVTSTPKYSAQTTLIVNEVVESGEMIREILNLPRVAGEQSLVIQKRVTSYTILLAVARQLNLREYLQERWAADVVDTTMAGTLKRNLRDVLVRLRLKNPRGEVTDRRVVEYLNSIMSMRVQQNFVTITIEHAKPQMAESIANTIAGVYVADTRRRRRGEVEHTSNFLGEEIAKAKQELDAAEQALREANEAGLIRSLNEQNVELIELMANAEAAAFRLKMQITEKEEEISRLIAKREAISPELARQRATVAQLEKEYEGFRRQGLSSAFPKVARKESELNLAQAQLDLMEKERTRAQAEAEAELKQARDGLTNLRIDLQNAESRRSDSRDAMNRLPADVTSLSNLLVRKRNAEEAYRFLEQQRYKTQYLQSNVTSNVGSVATIFEPARLPEVPINSSTSIVIGGGVAFGLGLGLALILAFEYFSHAVNSVKEAEQYFKGVPVVGVVPRLHFSKR